MSGRARVVTAMTLSELRRLARDRVGLFFVFLLPLIVVIAIGSFIPEADTNLIVAVVDEDRTEGSRELTAALEEVPGVEVREGLDRREAEREVRIKAVSGVVVLPEGFEEAMQAEGGVVDVVVDPVSSEANLVRTTLGELLSERSARLVVARALSEGGATDVESSARDAVGELERSEVAVRLTDEESEESNYAFVAVGQTILFMFVNSLAAAAGFIEIRRRQILARITSGRVDAGDVLAGIGLSRLIMSFATAAVIILLASGMFGVAWGDPVVVVSVLVLFGLAAAGGSALLGSVLDNPDSAMSIGIPVGLAMAALGGCMFPMFLAPQAMQITAKVLTPHAWAVDALLQAGYDGAGVAEVWTNLLVLAVWAVVLIGLARMLARRKLVS